jgi:hypoxanthine phosphoribosyltransferase
MEVLISAERIQARIGELARQITADYGHEHVTLLGVLTGALMFVADLVRQLGTPSRIGFLQASSYKGPTTTPGKLELLTAMVPDIRDHHVILVDDILDSGKTLAEVIRQLSELKPRSLKVAVLLRKIGRQQVPLEPHYCGFEVPDRFVVGYGMDYNDEYRHLPYVGVLDGMG